MNTTSIATSAALLRITPLSVYSPASALDEMADEFAARHSVDRGQLRAARKMLPPGLFDPLKETMKEIVAYLHDHSSPWSEGGVRIVQAGKVADTEFALAPLINRFHAQRETILLSWPAVEADMRQRLNGAFDEEKFPSPEKIRKHTTIEMTWSPLATGSDWRIDVPQSIVDSTEAALRTQLQEQQQHIRGRVIDTIRALMDKCRQWEPGKSKLHASTFERVGELVKIIPGLLLVEDTLVSSACADAAAMLDGLTPDDVKDSDFVRRKVADEAADILKRMGIHA